MRNGDWGRLFVSMWGIDLQLHSPAHPNQIQLTQPSQTQIRPALKVLILGPSVVH